MTTARLPPALLLGVRGGVDARGPLVEEVAVPLGLARHVATQRLNTAIEVP